MALTFTPQDEIGTPMPHFKLPGVDDKNYSDSDFKNPSPLLVMFICNHCPYVKAVEDRLIQLGHDLKKMDISTVAICSNDSDEYPEDNFANLKKRWSEKKYSFPYLHDETQTVAKAFGAICTPDFFLYDKDRKLAYRGRLDDSWKDAARVTKQELLNAARLLKETSQVPSGSKPSMGCSIKWKNE